MTRKPARWPVQHTNRHRDPQLVSLSNNTSADPGGDPPREPERHHERRHAWETASTKPGSRRTIRGAHPRGSRPAHPVSDGGPGSAPRSRRRPFGSRTGCEPPHHRLGCQLLGAIRGRADRPVVTTEIHAEVDRKHRTADATELPGCVVLAKRQDGARRRPLTLRRCQ